jgi:hypothetical protein
MEQLEKEKTREELIAEAGALILDNLTDGGLAEKIVEKSAHAEKPFSRDLYTGIEFGWEMGAGSFKNGIWAVPRMSDVNCNQPVTFRIFGIMLVKPIRRLFLKQQLSI